MSRARLRGCALAALALAWLAEPASAQPERALVFLPSVERGGDLALPCRPVDGGACPGTAGWRLVCGGFGALRDLYADPGSATVMGIGDGVASLRIASANGEPPEPGAWWFQGQLHAADPDYDRVLTGLRGFGVNQCRTGEPGCNPGWAWGVGGRPWIARFDGDCWQSDTPLLLPDGQRAREGDARLASLVPTRGGGLAVGEREGAAAHAERLDGGWAWRLAPESASAGIPSLFDVDVLGGPFDSEAWAVGLEGTVARMALSDGVWRRAARLEGGSARELTMLGASEGWAFGMAAGSGGARDTVVWRYDGTGWREEARYPGQTLIDAYKAGTDTVSILLGLTPGPPGAPVLHLLSRGRGGRAVAAAPPGGGGGGGHRAIAPLADGRILYAAGSEVWLFDKAAGWTRLRRRIDLRAVVPDGRQAWVLAATAGGSRILRVDARGRLVDPDGAAADLPPLRAMAGGAELWAVGDAGATWRRQPARGTWEPMVAAGALAVDLADVARDDAGGLWSAGGADGLGRLLRWDDQTSRWQPVATAEAPLRAIAALAGGGAVAVGGRAIVTVQPAERCQDGGAATVIAGGRSWCVATLAPCYSGYCLDGLSAVASAPGALWVANHTYVLRHRAGGSLTRWREGDWPARIPSIQGAAKPQESAITALAVGGRDDGWAVFGCCSGRDAPGHETSYAVRFDGSRWTEAIGISVPVRDAVLAEGEAGGTLWLAGDWSTLVARPPR